MGKSWCKSLQVQFQERLSSEAWKYDIINWLRKLNRRHLDCVQFQDSSVLVLLIFLSKAKLIQIFLFRSNFNFLDELNRKTNVSLIEFAESKSDADGGFRYIMFDCRWCRVTECFSSAERKPKTDNFREIFYFHYVQHQILKLGRRFLQTQSDLSITKIWLTFWKVALILATFSLSI